MIEEENQDKSEKEIEVIQAKPIEQVAKKQPRIVNFIKVGTLNIYNQLPPKLQKPLKTRYQRFYQKNKVHVWLDVLFILIILFLLIFNLFFILNKDSCRLSVDVGNIQLVNIEKEDLSAKINLNLEQELINNPQAIISQGQDFILKITYQNSGSQDLQNLNLMTNIESQDLQYQLLSGNLKKNYLHLNSGKKLENEIKLKFVSSSENVVKIQSELTFEANRKSKKISSEVFYLKVNSDLKFISSARYFTKEGDQLGIGPLPPEVNKKTSYWLFWQLDNSLNDLADVQVSGFLPANVSYSGKSSVTSGEGLKYEANERKIIWQLGKLAKEQKTVQASFEVEIIPTLAQIKTAPLLMREIMVKAKDSYTNQLLELSSNNITTFLLYDDFAKDLGTVIQ
ncbi:hypothetical protein KKF32_04910 [Patescibacteria group bacterium]|nr:hypothetical protein [Patescibacteria group bacterium]